jgi:hypothetical protein
MSIKLVIENYKITSKLSRIFLLKVSEDIIIILYNKTDKTDMIADEIKIFRSFHLISSLLIIKRRRDSRESSIINIKKKDIMSIIILHQLQQKT